MSARAAIIAAVAVSFAIGVPLGLHVAEPEQVAPAVGQADTGPSLTFADLAFAAAGTEPAEGDPAFDCRRHGDHVCRLGNPQGVPPGLYRVSTAVDLSDLMVPAIAGGAR